MNGKKKRRQKLFADRKLQGALLVHTSIYWVYCLFSVTLIAACWILFTQQPETSFDLFGQLWLSCGPALLGSILLLPLVLLDCLRLSNRFAGPMVRFQRAMSELVENGQTAPVKLRDGDYWLKFADDFNIIAEKIKNQATTAEVEEQTLAELTQLADSLVPTDQPTAAEAATPIEVTPAAPVTDEATAQNIYSDLSI